MLDLHLGSFPTTPVGLVCRLLWPGADFYFQMWAVCVPIPPLPWLRMGHHRRERVRQCLWGPAGELLHWRN